MSRARIDRKPAIRRRGRLRECASAACSSWLAPESHGAFCRDCRTRSQARPATKPPNPEEAHR